MSDVVLFAVVPWLSLIVLTVAGIARMLRTVKSLTLSPAAGRFRISWYASLAVSVVLISHAVMIVWPDAIVNWPSDPSRLLVLEVCLFTLGVAATAAVTLALRRRQSDEGMQVGDALFAGVLLVAMVSGLAVAVAHRWAAAWSATTLAPYVRSLASLQPSVERVADLPYLVRLHLFSSFILVALLPFTRFIDVPRHLFIRAGIVLEPVFSTLERQWTLLQESASRRGRRLMWPEDEED
jgi:nitrate reductase gamma subunit